MTPEILPPELPPILCARSLAERRRTQTGAMLYRLLRSARVNLDLLRLLDREAAAASRKD